ncbi:hypothetical protein JCM6294_1220 [Bacteroides pyogenes DSM 20611 = JCM 6294]|uniref:Uncharacterized protein n=1 Tax=Bacteroides pyogenes DSM 20611 = JCM 6294 TaxID=1121100 RepID=W4PEV7_9BACE|nr:hypothetical protein JCM6294_1220 [Bacteroides pyogenes DSM 20611 = JCM 6294]
MGNFCGNSGKLSWQQSGSSVQAKERLCSSQRKALFGPKRGSVQAKERLRSSQREARSGKAEVPLHKRLYRSYRNGHGKPPSISPLYW